jgi:predicted O-methyltransferase YrrM
VLRASRLELGARDIDAERAIDGLRRRLSQDDRLLEVADHGAGTRGFVGSTGKPSTRRVSDIYRRAAATPAWGRFLFALVRECGSLRILELGTNLGISAAHLCAALAANERKQAAGRLVTIEGDPGLAALAREHLHQLGHAARCRVVVGRFADVLDSVKTEHAPFDLAFIDGHHEERAAHAYWRSLRPAMAAGGCVAFDDIEPGRPVRRAWRRIVADERLRGASAVDLLGMGLLFVPGAETDARAEIPTRSRGQ